MLTIKEELLSARVVPPVRTITVCASLSVECVPLLREECRVTKLNSRPYGDPVAAGDDAMEVSFDLEHGVVPPSVVRLAKRGGK